MEQVERLAALFRGYAGAHGTHGEPVQEGGNLKWTIRSTAKTLRSPITLDLWRGHLAGDAPLGVISIREDSSCYWGSIDYDVYDADLMELIGRVERNKFPLIPCRSKSGGLHLFMFLQEPQAAASLIVVLRDFAAQLGLGQCEIFPKQTHILAERGDLGAWMVMPYYGSTFNGHIHEQVGLRRTGGELTLEEFLRAAENVALNGEEFLKLLETKRKKSANGVNRGPFSDGPPCLQHLSAEGVDRGGQNNFLLMLGIYYKKAFPGEWKTKLEQANQEYLKPPGTSDGLVSVIRSLEKKDYEYTCKAEPMTSHCESRTCRTRRYGVGSWGEYPNIEGLSVLVTEPAIWFVDVDGDRIEISTSDLQVYNRFHAVCMERLHRCYKTMKQDSWLHILNAAMENVVTIEASPDSRPGSAMHELVEEFLTNRAAGRRREDLLSMRPWLNDNEDQYEFPLRALQKFLKREAGQEIPRSKLTRELERMGGKYKFSIVSGRGINYWCLPAEQFSSTPEVDVPSVVDGNGAGSVI